ncbi:TetR/AcrR family transcriptional regulator [Heyndrickxia coagulans]|uniref:Transcriptional regulator, TetR family n=1 Tax=Heyndrickxia coagulans 36D1 TaxID=345219 RepID=G2TRF2_HEYCO|nr:TetR/AcrR family transcriptional regulator [Heyndrickxia coagulans]AEP00228.1 transcriptional regulator, TetR family [Heyndrickxia coagulans 36D1]
MKAKITEHSIRLFEQKGFTETSIQDIVDSIGATKGTFYYYFSSKEQLLMDIHMDYITKLLEKQKAILSENGSCKAKLHALVLMLLESIKTEKAKALIFFREIKNLSGEKLELILQKREAFRLGVEKLIREGIEIGEFAGHLDANLTSFAILGMVNWSYQWFQPEGRKSAAEVAELFMDIVLHGIEKA